MSAIIQGTASDRLSRALNSRTRPAGELLELKIGDEVDIYRAPPNKDLSGWRGPAVVTDLTRLREGMIGVRWQSRNMQVRLPEVHVRWCCGHYLSNPMHRKGIEQGSLYFGCVFSSKHGWTISKDGQRFPGPMRAAFITAACHLQLMGCIGVR
eukprot:1332581-Pyramimonas_sp.AAC.1